MLKVGQQGKFTFREPIGNFVMSDKSYKIVSVRAIKELIDYRQDPYNTIYKPYGITEDVYRKDVKDNINIITLTNHLGVSYLYVPETYIVGVPETAEYEYVDTLLAINLGGIHRQTDLSIVKEEIIDLIRTIMGITVEIKSVEVSEVSLLTAEEHDIRTRAIHYGGVKHESYRLKYNALQEAYQKLYKFTEGIKTGIKVDISTT